MTCSRDKKNGLNSNYGKLWLGEGVENFETVSPSGLQDIKCGWSKYKNRGL